MMAMVIWFFHGSLVQIVVLCLIGLFFLWLGTLWAAEKVQRWWRNLWK